MRRAISGSIATLAIVVVFPVTAQTRRPTEPTAVPTYATPVPRTPVYDITGAGSDQMQMAAGDPLPGVDVSLDKKPSGQSYRGVVARDGSIQLPQVPPGSYTLTIRFRDAVATPAQPAPAAAPQREAMMKGVSGSPVAKPQPPSKSFFESRSNVANRVVGSGLTQQAEWRKFDGAYPWVFAVTGTNVRRVSETIVRAGADVRIQQELFIEGNQPVTVSTAVVRAPANLQVVPERNLSH